MVNDVTVEGSSGSSVFLFLLHTTAAREWVAGNVSDATMLGNNLAVEHRFARQLSDAMQNDGLTVE